MDTDAEIRTDEYLRETTRLADVFTLNFSAFALNQSKEATSKDRAGLKGQNIQFNKKYNFKRSDMLSAEQIQTQGPEETANRSLYSGLFAKMLSMKTRVHA